LIDRYGREVRGLRVSLTQRCNLNCVYCHHEGETSPISEMTSKEVLRIVRVAKSLGVRRVKYTGGEPLLREDLSEIIHGTLALDLEDVAITTNGTLLKRQVDSLAVAGLRRLNVSLPSIRPCIYTSLTEGQFSDVFDGIRAAKRLGMELKINVVIMRGVNEEEVNELLEFAISTGGSLQLIELEDLNVDKSFFRERHKDLAEIERRLAKRADRIIERDDMNSRRRYIFGSLIVEVVRATNNPHFCMNCTRLRITSDGKLKPCLMRSDNLVDLLGPMREGCSDEDLKTLFLKASGLRSPYYRQPN